MNSSDEAADALVETLVTELGQRGPTYRRALHRLAAAVRAEAVADERRRIADAIEREVSDWSDIPLTGTTTIPDRVLVIDGLTIAFRLVAAGSVPVATPEPEATLRDVWGKIHVARFAIQNGETAAPDLFYAGVIHSERIIEKALGFRPGSMASDPREQDRVANPPVEPAATRLWPCEHGERGWHRTDDNRHCLGGAAPSQPATCDARCGTTMFGPCSTCPVLPDETADDQPHS